MTDQLQETANTAATREPEATADNAAQAMRSAREHLLALQNDGGWWKGELQTNITMDVEDLLLRQFLGVRTESETAEAARWIRSQQRSNGTWATYYDGPGDLSTTVEGYVALKLAGDDVESPHMVEARHWILDNGGIEATRVFTRIWLALFGEWPWTELPAMPPELMFLPPWVPLNIADWGCWARQTIVPLTVVCTVRPQRSLGISTNELRVGQRHTSPHNKKKLDWTTVFNGLDRVLHRYHKHSVRWLRNHAMRRAAEWIVARQEADGCWGGIQPSWVYSLLALHSLGYPLSHPVMREGLAGFERFLIRENTDDGVVRRLEACQSPVWDTVLSVQALRDAQLPADHSALRAASDFIRNEEITIRGDWAVRRPRLNPSGWAFEFDNDGYPDIDDTAEALMALNRVEHSDPENVRATLARGQRWMRGMQSKDDGWGAFDADNTRQLITKLPFCDFGAVIDPPSADVTAHVVESLCALGHGRDHVVGRGVNWLLSHQESDGSWYGRWGANHIYGTGAVVPALVRAGLPENHLALRRAVQWLEEHQNDDGGWGEDLRSYVDKSWIGRGDSTPSQTAWALMALLALHHHETDSVRRGIDYLSRTQRTDGNWDEPQFTGTGFPGDFYINYHLYRLVFPLSALGRYRRAVEGT